MDLIEYVPWQSFQAIESNNRLKMESTMGPFKNLLFNGRSGPFKDTRLRQAVAYAVRRQEIVDAVFFGRGATLGGLPLAPGSAKVRLADALGTQERSTGDKAGE